jgi:amicyanin
MNKIGVCIAIALATLVGVSAIIALTNVSDKEKTSNSAIQDAENQTNENNIQVTIKDHKYNPETLTIKKGTTVTWTNQDSVKHDVAPDEESPNFEASELLAKGENYSYTFNQSGTYSYHCTPHPFMTAKIIVE